jgi:D-galactarolactone isomerase
VTPASGRAAPTPPAGMPPRACDCHIHIYGPREKYPLAPTSPFAPPLATVADYRRAVMDELGTQRVVLVQPAAYGTDNRCLVDALHELGDCARGVATILPDIGTAELEHLHAAGVRAARALMLKGGVLRFDQLPELAARIRSLGWHIQLQMDGRELPRHIGMLAELPVPLVIDHNGKFLEPVGRDDAALGLLLGLLDSGRCWVKASAPYETSRRGPPGYEDVGVIASAIVERRPDRVVWATNWPHGGVVGTKPSDRMLFEVLGRWVPDAETRRRILVDNPQQLYGFQ